MPQQLQNGGLVVRAKGQRSVPEPLDVLDQGINGIVLRVYALLWHYVSKDGFAQGILRDQYREVNFGNLEYRSFGHWDASLVKVQVIEREYTDLSSILPPAVLFASAASSYTLAAPAAIGNVPFGTVVFYVRGSRFAWAWKNASFGLLDLTVIVQINVVVQGFSRDHWCLSSVLWLHVLCLDCIVISEQIILISLAISVHEVWVCRQVHSMHFLTPLFSTEDHLS